MSILSALGHNWKIQGNDKLFILLNVLRNDFDFINPQAYEVTCSLDVAVLI